MVFSTRALHISHLYSSSLTSSSDSSVEFSMLRSGVFVFTVSELSFSGFGNSIWEMSKGEGVEVSIDLFSWPISFSSSSKPEMALDEVSLSEVRAVSELVSTIGGNGFAVVFFLAIVVSGDLPGGMAGWSGKALLVVVFDVVWA